MKKKKHHQDDKKPLKSARAEEVIKEFAREGYSYDEIQQIAEMMRAEIHFAQNRFLKQIPPCY